MKSWTYYFNMKMEILIDFQIYISIPLNAVFKCVCIQMFVTRNLFLETIVNKNTVYLTPTLQSLWNLHRVWYDEKSVEIQKTSLLKASVENAEFYKPIMNKIMTTNKLCLKYNFVAPLSPTLKKWKNPPPKIAYILINGTF